jgi:hypothetical protein
MCHKAHHKNNQAISFIKFGTHKHHSNRLDTALCAYPVYVQVPQFVGILNTCIICTHVPQFSEQVHKVFSSFTSRASAHSYGERYNKAAETTFTIGGGRDSCYVLTDRFNAQFRLRHGSPTRRCHPQ